VVEKQKCLICGQDMKLLVGEHSSYYQCASNETHRISLAEFSDLGHEKKSEEEIRSVMQNRAQKLQKQIDEEAFEK
jgi:hypothetical protein